MHAPLTDYHKSLLIGGWLAPLAQCRIAARWSHRTRIASTAIVAAMHALVIILKGVETGFDHKERDTRIAIFVAVMIASTLHILNAHIRRLPERLDNAASEAMHAGHRWVARLDQSCQNEEAELPHLIEHIHHILVRGSTGQSPATRLDTATGSVGPLPSCPPTPTPAPPPAPDSCPAAPAPDTEQTPDPTVVHSAINAARGFPSVLCLVPLVLHAPLPAYHKQLLIGGWIAPLAAVRGLSRWIRWERILVTGAVEVLHALIIIVQGLEMALHDERGTHVIVFCLAALVSVVHGLQHVQSYLRQVTAHHSAEYPRAR
jgi:hypothetical protein